MIVFACPHCERRIYFDNLGCEHCGVDVAYSPATDSMTVAEHPCPNRHTAESCNWTASEVDSFCASCALDVDHHATAHRQPFQAAKRRTIRQLLGVGIDVGRREPPLRFELAESTPSDPVTTGHADGLVTLDVTESIESHRVKLRNRLGEPYRTPLGHVRHELGHWWWATAIGAEIDVEEFRQVFGDERRSYSEALEQHYGSPDTGDWADTHISHYAASHPWEDFAESFAHVLHVYDTFETASAHGVASGGVVSTTFDEIHPRWIDLTIALNELNRAMGHPDAYPFAPPPTAVRKLAFVADRLPAATALRGT